MSIRIGVLYYGSGARIRVESGSKTIGHTSMDVKIGQHVFWFKDVDDFKRLGGRVLANGVLVWPKDLFEMAGHNRPVPIVLPEASAPPDHKPATEEECATFIAWAKEQISEAEALLVVLAEKKAAEDAMSLSEGEKLSIERPLGGEPSDKAIITVNDETGRIEMKAPEAPAPPDGEEGVSGGIGDPGGGIVDETVLAAMSDGPTGEPEKADAEPATPQDLVSLLNGRTLRLKEFAAELKRDPVELKAEIEADSRFAPIHAGWLKLEVTE